MNNLDRYSFFYRLVLLLTFCLLPGGVEAAEAPADTTSAAQDMRKIPEARSDSLLSLLKKQEGAVSYWGELVQSRLDEKTIFLCGDAGVTYGETTLKADSILYNYDTGMLTAWGSPVLSDAGSRVEGRRMTYRLDEDKGIVEEGSTTYDDWIFEGDVISKIGDREIYGKGSRFTTCDLEHPHYYFACNRFKLTIDDKVIARPIVFYVYDIPLLFVPFYIFPVRKGRQSGFLKPKFGIFNDDRRGRSITDLGYFFALSDYYDLTIAGDIYENARWSIRGEGRYARRYRYKGNIFYSFTEDALSSSRRSLLRFRHDHTLNRETSLFVEGNFSSDRTIYSDVSFDIGEVLQRSLESRATYNRRASWGSYYVTGYNDYSLDRDKTRTQLPVMSISKSSSPVFSDNGEGWYDGLNYSMNSSFESTRLKDEEETTVYQTSSTNLVFTDPLKLRGFLNITPRVSLHGTYYHTGKDDTGFVHQEIWEGSASLFSRFYGIFNRPGIGPMTKWRHTISPKVSYSYRPDFDSSRFTGLSGFSGVGGEVNTLSFNLTDDFDAKYLDGDEEKKISLMSIVQSSSYSFVRARIEGQSGWGDMSTRVESRPSGRFRFSVQSSHSLFDGETFDPFLTSSTVTVSMKGGKRDAGSDTVSAVEVEELSGVGDELNEIVSEKEYSAPREISKLPWTFSLTHSLSRSRAVSGSMQSVYGSVSLNPTRKWRLTYSARYSFEEEKVQNQNLALRRDLHRWELLLSFVKLPANRFRYELRVNLIDLPAMEFKRSVKNY